MYIVQCSSVLEAGPEGSFVSEGVNSLSGFRPNTTYVCDLFAVNGAGEGPRNTTTFNTSDDSESNSLHTKCRHYT